MGKICVAPEIISPLEDRTVLEGDIAVFTIAVIGTALEYRWFHDNIPIEDADASSGSYSTHKYHNGSRFSVTVKNAAGEASSVATLIVLPKQEKELDLVARTAAVEAKTRSLITKAQDLEKTAQAASRIATAARAAANHALHEAANQGFHLNFGDLEQ